MISRDVRAAADSVATGGFGSAGESPLSGRNQDARLAAEVQALDSTLSKAECISRVWNRVTRAGRARRCARHLPLRPPAAIYRAQPQNARPSPPLIPEMP